MDTRNGSIKIDGGYRDVEELITDKESEPRLLIIHQNNRYDMLMVQRNNRPNSLWFRILSTREGQVFIFTYFRESNGSFTPYHSQQLYPAPKDPTPASRPQPPQTVTPERPKPITPTARPPSASFQSASKAVQPKPKTPTDGSKTGKVVTPARVDSTNKARPEIILVTFDGHNVYSSNHDDVVVEIDKTNKMIKIDYGQGDTEEVMPGAESRYNTMFTDLNGSFTPLQLRTATSVSTVTYNISYEHTGQVFILTYLLQENGIYTAYKPQKLYPRPVSPPSRPQPEVPSVQPAPSAILKPPSGTPPRHAKDTTINPPHDMKTLEPAKTQPNESIDIVPVTFEGYNIYSDNHTQVQLQVDRINNRINIDYGGGLLEELIHDIESTPQMLRTNRTGNYEVMNVQLTHSTSPLTYRMFYIDSGDVYIITYYRREDGFQKIHKSHILYSPHQ